MEKGQNDQQFLGVGEYNTFDYRSIIVKDGTTQKLILIVNLKHLNLLFSTQ